MYTCTLLALYLHSPAFTYTYLHSSARYLHYAYTVLALVCTYITATYHNIGR